MRNFKKGTVFLAVFAVFLGVVMATQLRMPSGIKLYVSAKALMDMEMAVESESENIKRTELQVEEAKKKLAEFRKLAEMDNTQELMANARAEAEYYKMLSGETALKGEGITVTIDDATRELYEGENINNVLVHDSDILLILNDLFTAGAEAVSVNGHRVVDMSAVTCSGYTVRINNIFTARPFVIKAIGDPGRLYAAMLAPGSYGEILKEAVLFQVTAEDEVEIPAYPNFPIYHYLKVNKEGDAN